MSIVIKENKKPTEVQVELLFGGDFCPIRRYEEKILAEKQIFDADLLKTFEEKDLFVVNLEAPFCTNYHNPKRHGGGLGVSPEIAKYLKEFKIDAVGLANNHILDKNQRGIEQTMKILEQSGIRHFGAGLNLAEAEKFAIFELKGLKVGILAVAERELNIAGIDTAGAAPFEPVLTAQKITALKDQVNFMVCYLHVGHEFMLTPSPRIRDACRGFIDAGADTVIAHHPHVPQGYEHYHGGWIFYSLGNLVFDSPYVSSYAETDHGYLVKLTIDKHEFKCVELIPYRLTPEIMVEAITGERKSNYADFLRKISFWISDDKEFIKQWEINVAMRWEQDYQGMLRNLSKRYCDATDLPFLNNLRNLFSCPTHNELLNQAFDMIEAGKIQR